MFKILNRHAFVWIEPFLPFRSLFWVCVLYGMGTMSFFVLPSFASEVVPQLQSPKSTCCFEKRRKRFLLGSLSPPPQRWSIAPLNFQRLDGKGREKGQFLGFFETSVSPKMGLVAAFFGRGVSREKRANSGRFFFFFWERKVCLAFFWPKCGKKNYFTASAPTLARKERRGNCKGGKGMQNEFICGNLGHFSSLPPAGGAKGKFASGLLLRGKWSKFTGYCMHDKRKMFKCLIVQIFDKNYGNIKLFLFFLRSVPLKVFQTYMQHVLINDSEHTIPRIPIIAFLPLLLLKFRLQPSRPCRQCDV